jgi:DNA-binding transcriptional MerR regulator
VEKARDAFRTISEVASELDVPQHVLRFWESRFREIKPMKRGGGRRYYRPEDVNLLRGVRHLLYGEGYTIRGVQRILREQGIKFVQVVWQPGALQPAHGAADELDGATDPVEISKADALEVERGRGLLSLLPSLLGDPLEHERAERRPPVEIPDPDSLPSRKLVPPLAPTLSNGLSRDDLRKLQAALQELAECRKLIDAALQAAA